MDELCEGQIGRNFEVSLQRTSLVKKNGLRRTNKSTTSAAILPYLWTSGRLPALTTECSHLWILTKALPDHRSDT